MSPNSELLNFHLMHPGRESLPGDPNAAFYLDGVYHLHYILAHPWRGETSYSFIHVTSPDMLHWEWHSTKLQPAFTGHGMYSGTGFMTKEGLPAVIYHGQGSGRNQIAIATDRKLSEWQRPYPVNVQTTNGQEAKINHWDPDCFLIGDTYYAISGGTHPPIFKSNNLKRWTLIGDFLSYELPDVMIGEDISCANFFQIENKWMLLCISHNLGCRYYLGDWDHEAEQFVPETHGRLNWRRDNQPVYGLFQRTDFFAPESVLTPDGRRVMWAWLTSVGDNNALHSKTVQSLPRELSLASDGSLRMRPLRELEAQRYDWVRLEDVVIDTAVTDHRAQVPPSTPPTLQSITGLESDSLEIQIVIPREQALRKLFGFVLFATAQNKGLPILLRPENGTLRVANAETPFAVSDLPQEEDVVLHIFIDKYLVEVFANNRQALVSAQRDYSEKSSLSAFSVGAPTTIQSIEIWKLRPTNQGGLTAQTNRIWEPLQGDALT
ncbi:MAG: glycoside hydrolase family 32 protein [Chloroflexota bacterium]